MSEKNSSLIGHAGIILTGLIIGYFLLITNPPPDLLQYDADLQIAVTHYLSGSEIINHFISISIFLITFFLISTFLTFVTKRTLAETKWEYVDVRLTIISIAVLGFIALPYYGPQLTLILYSTGVTGYFVGLWLFYPTTSSGNLIRFCTIIPVLVFSMWALADFELSLVWFLAFPAIFIISRLSQRIRIRRELKERRRG